MRFFSTLNSTLKSTLQSSSSKPVFDRIQRLLQPSKVTENFQKESVPFHLKNGTDHFTLPLQRIIFTYCPHNGDSRALMEYLSKNIIQFAKSHPSVEVIVTCKFSSRAKIEAFYSGDFEHRRLVYVSGGQDLTWRDVELQVQRLRDCGGMKARRFKMQVLSDTPAVRPIYSQFLHPNPRTNFKFK